MQIIYSRNNVPIRLTEERWRHIRHRHPEMQPERDRILETLESPELIQAGDYGALMAARYYEQTTLTSKWLVVVYREVNRTDGFIVTAYLTNSLSKRRPVVWKK